jgi:hypothetical protein
MMFSEAVKKSFSGNSRCACWAFYSFTNGQMLCFFNVKMVKTNTLGNIRIKFTVHNDIALVKSDFFAIYFQVSDGWTKSAVDEIYNC